MATLSIALLSPTYPVAHAQDTPTQTALPEEEAPKIPNDQLDSLVAPIALYPDPLLSQTLVASTYPLEIIQLQQWLGKNENLKDKALADAVEKKNWDPSVQAMVALPTVVKQLSDNIAWTSNLGNAFLAQESDVMEAVQRMRVKAEGAGTLQTSQQQTVETQQVEGKSVVVIQPANPEVVTSPPITQRWSMASRPILTPRFTIHLSAPTWPGRHFRLAWAWQWDLFGVTGAGVTVAAGVAMTSTST